MAQNLLVTSERPNKIRTFDPSLCVSTTKSTSVLTTLSTSSSGGQTWYTTSGVTYMMFGQNVYKVLSCSSYVTAVINTTNPKRLDITYHQHTQWYDSDRLQSVSCTCLVGPDECAKEVLGVVVSSGSSTQGVWGRSVNVTLKTKNIRASLSRTTSPYENNELDYIEANGVGGSASKSMVAYYMDTLHIEPYGETWGLYDAAHKYKDEKKFDYAPNKIKEISRNPSFTEYVITEDVIKNGLTIKSTGGPDKKWVNCYTRKFHSSLSEANLDSETFTSAQQNDIIAWLEDDLLYNTDFGASMRDYFCIYNYNDASTNVYKTLYCTTGGGSTVVPNAEYGGKAYYRIKYCIVQSNGEWEGGTPELPGNTQYVSPVYGVYTDQAYCSKVGDPLLLIGSGEAESGVLNLVSVTYGDSAIVNGQELGNHYAVTVSGDSFYNISRALWGVSGATSSHVKDRMMLYMVILSIDVMA